MTPGLETSSLSPELLRRRAESGKLFLVIDGCVDRSLAFELVRAPPAEVRCLLAGDAERDLWAVAPYLVRATLGWLETLASRWQEPWGILALSDTSFEVLRRHFRRLLRVRGPAGDPWHFRYYDPRVLRHALPHLTAAELGALFGPVAALGWARPTGEVLVVRRVPDLAVASDPAPVGAPPLSITPKLAEMLGRASQLEFEHRVVAHLRLGLGAAVGREEEARLATSVRVALGGGRACGQTAERDLATYATVALALPGHFPAGAAPLWAQRILDGRAGLAPEGRATALVEAAARVLDGLPIDGS